MCSREQLLSMQGLGDTGFLCSSFPGQEYLADGPCGSASSSTPPQTTLALATTAQALRKAKSWPGVPWQAHSTEGSWEMQAGATLLFFFLGIETPSNYCEERTACPLLHIPCPLPAIWIVFGRICLTWVGAGGRTFFSHLQILRNCRRKEQSVHWVQSKNIILLAKGHKKIKIISCCFPGQ